MQTTTQPAATWHLVSVLATQRARAADNVRERHPRKEERLHNLSAMLEKLSNPTHSCMVSSRGRSRGNSRVDETSAGLLVLRMSRVRCFMRSVLHRFYSRLVSKQGHPRLGQECEREGRQLRRHVSHTKWIGPRRMWAVNENHDLPALRVANIVASSHTCLGRWYTMTRSCAG